MLGYIDKIKEIAEATPDRVQGGHGHRFPKGHHAHDERTLLGHHSRCDVTHLVWDSNCGINLANYLTNRKEKIGIVAKGCDSRNIVTHIIENKIKRDQLYIIGVPCKGMIDKRKITAMVPRRNPGGHRNRRDQVTVKAADVEERLRQSRRAAAKLRHLHPPQSGDLR